MANYTKEGAQEFFEAMRDDPELVAERVGWLLNGSYGEDEMKKAQSFLEGHGNHVAFLTQYVGELDWNSKPDSTRRNWHKLTAEQQEYLGTCVQIEIDDWKKEHGLSGVDSTKICVLRAKSLKAAKKCVK